MAYKGRLIVPGEPHHITQRGNAKQEIFKYRDDYLRYLVYLQRQLERAKIPLTAFCLMPNHIHLVVIPPDEESVSGALGRAHLSYARSFNRSRHSSGHVWQGRYYSCAMDPAHHYRAVRYVELNPVRAGMVESAYAYEWSSAAFHGGKAIEPPVVKLAPLGEEWGNLDWSLYLDQREAEQDRAQIRQSTALGSPWRKATVEEAPQAQV